MELSESVLFRAFSHLWKKCNIVHAMLAMSICPSVSLSVTSRYRRRENALSVPHCSEHWVIFVYSLIFHSISGRTLLSLTYEASNPNLKSAPWACLRLSFDLAVQLFYRNPGHNMGWSSRKYEARFVNGGVWPAGRTSPDPGSIHTSSLHGKFAGLRRLDALFPAWSILQIKYACSCSERIFASWFFLISFKLGGLLWCMLIE
jgi:hypothetical protein